VSVVDRHHVFDVRHGPSTDLRQIDLQRTRRVRDGAQRLNELEAGVTAEEGVGPQSGRQPHQADSGESDRRNERQPRTAYSAICHALIAGTG
jgi:hypothetical protein